MGSWWQGWRPFAVILVSWRAFCLLGDRLGKLFSLFGGCGVAYWRLCVPLAPFLVHRPPTSYAEVIGFGVPGEGYGEGVCLLFAESLEIW